MLNSLVREALSSKVTFLSKVMENKIGKIFLLTRKDVSDLVKRK